MQEKPKVFIRFLPGASGNFVALMLRNMFQPVMENHIMGSHIDSHAVWGDHNFKMQSIGYTPNGKGKFGKSDEFQFHTEKNIVISDSVDYMRNTFQFYETESPLYTVPTHALNPVGMMYAFKNSKLVNIKSTVEDNDQILYNSLNKFIIPNKATNLVQNILDDFKRQYPDKKLTNKFSSVNFDDERFLFYLFKFAKIDFYKNFNEFELGQKYDYIDLPFNKMQTMEVFDYVPRIADYIGLELKNDRKMAANKLLHEYAISQKPNPYTDLHIDDY